MYYVYTDRLGSYHVITDETGSELERLSFDPWGLRRNSGDWGKEEAAGTNHLFSRGFTGHEHLDDYKTINMNGRLYDPVIATFFSPDPFVADATSTQDFNRYSYARNNPLMYTDPDGEWVNLVVGAVIGGIVNATVNSKNIQSFADAGKYFGIGMISGALGAGIGTGVNVAMAGGSFGAGFWGTTTGVSSIGFVAGAATGASAGFAGGFVTGVGNSWLGGNNFRQGLWDGVKEGVMGALIGGVTGGIIGQLQHMNETYLFRKGCETLGVGEGDPVPATDRFLLDAQKAWHPNAPMDKVGDFTTENIPSGINMIDKNGNLAYGRTVPTSLNSKFTGISDVYFSKIAFSSAKQLFVTMGHEFVHVNQFAVLAGQSSSLMKNAGFMEFIEHQAYQYDHIFLDRIMNSFDYNLMRSFSNKYSNIIKLLNYDAVYGNLPRKLPNF